MKKQTDTVDFSRWVCLYPVYINAKKTCEEGRRIPKNKAVENPTAAEMAEVCRNLGLQCIVEAEKYYPRNFLMKGRLRVELKTVEGKIINESIPNRKILMMKLASIIPRLPNRGVQQSQTDTGGRQGGKKDKRKKKQTCSVSTTIKGS